MEGSDLFVLVPWVIFGVGLAIVFFWLRPPRRSYRRPPSPGPGAPPEGQPDPGEDVAQKRPAPEEEAAGRRPRRPSS
jgi:hypothetical protein